MIKIKLSGLALILGIPYSQAADNSSLELPTSWTLLEIRCPIGCFETTVNYFNPQIGHTLDLNAEQKEGSPLGSCSRGQLHFVLEDLPVKDVLIGMNETLPAEAVSAEGVPLRFTLDNTGLGYSAYGQAQIHLKTGILECRDTIWKDRWEQRKHVLSIDAHRMVTLEEDGALAIYYARNRECLDQKTLFIERL